VPALIYYISVSLSVYLLATFYHTHMVVDRNAKGLDWRDRVNIGAFVFVVGGLVTLMSTIFLAPMFAALYMFCATAAGLVAIHVGGLIKTGQLSLRTFIQPLQRFLDSYIDMISDIALLLATLSIMTGALVITGVPTKLGALLVDAAGEGIVGMNWIEEPEGIRTKIAEAEAMGTTEIIYAPSGPDVPRELRAFAEAAGL